MRIKRALGSRGSQLVLIFAAGSAITSLLVGALIIGQERGRTVTPDLCQPVDSLPPLPKYGVVGEALGPTLRAGLRPGYRLGPLSTVQIRDPEGEEPSYAVSANVLTESGQPMGAALWQSPETMAVAASAGFHNSDEVAKWLANPAAQPQTTYLFAANALATSVAVWRPSMHPLARSQRAAAVRCLASMGSPIRLRRRAPRLDALAEWPATAVRHFVVLAVLPEPVLEPGVALAMTAVLSTRPVSWSCTSPDGVVGLPAAGAAPAGCCAATS